MTLKPTLRTSDRIRGHDLLLELLSGKTDFKGVRIFEEGFNFCADRTFSLLVEYLKSRDFTERKNRISLEMAQFNDVKAPGLNIPYLMARGANMNFADLSGADFNNADFRRAGFKRSKMVGINLQNAYLTGAIFTDADLSEANLTDSMLNDANMVGAKMTRANLTNARLKYTRMDNANLQGADLTGADLSGAGMARVDLRGAILEKANFKGALMKDIIVDGQTRTAGAIGLNLDIKMSRPGDDDELGPPAPPPAGARDKGDKDVESAPADKSAPAGKSVPAAAAGGTTTQASVQKPPPPPPPPPPPTHFHGCIELDAVRVGKDAVYIANEVILQLSMLGGAKISVTMDIKADIPAGAPAHIVNAVTEKCKVFKFIKHDFYTPESGK